MNLKLNAIGGKHSIDLSSGFQFDKITNLNPRFILQNEFIVHDAGVFLAFD